MKFLVWSTFRRAWWRPGGEGYTRLRAEAGRFLAEDLVGLGLNAAEGDTPDGADVLVLDEGE